MNKTKNINKLSKVLSADRKSALTNAALAFSLISSTFLYFFLILSFLVIGLEFEKYFSREHYYLFHDYYFIGFLRFQD